MAKVILTFGWGKGVAQGFDPRPEIHGQWQHDAIPHHLVGKLNPKTLSSGIHIPIQSDADML